MIYLVLLPRHRRAPECFCGHPGRNESRQHIQSNWCWRLRPLAWMCYPGSYSRRISPMVRFCRLWYTRWIPKLKIVSDGRICKLQMGKDSAWIADRQEWILISSHFLFSVTCFRMHFWPKGNKKAHQKWFNITIFTRVILKTGLLGCRFQKILKKWVILNCWILLKQKATPFRGGFLCCGPHFNYSTFGPMRIEWVLMRQMMGSLGLRFNSSMASCVTSTAKRLPESM